MNTYKMLLTALFLFTFSGFVIASGEHDDSDKSSASSEYNKGKTIVHKKITCDSCPMKGAELNKTLAKDIVSKLNKGDKTLGSLEATEVKVVVTYLQERFSL